MDIVLKKGSKNTYFYEKTIYTKKAHSPHKSSDEDEETDELE